MNVRGRVSMYRLVLAALWFVLLLAVVLALTGALAYPALGIVAVLAVATAATVVGTSLGALATRSRPQLVSSFVTGAILTLVLFPGVEGRILLAAMVAGGAAGLSKYLVAWRGAHVLNPAVVGIVVVTLSGLGAGAWWVGTAALAPAVVLLGGLVVWRSGRIGFALSYAIPALLLTAGGYLSLGAAPHDAWWWALTASPILFLAFFMLPEPLTTPPRRVQRIGVGAGVAVLASAPLFLGWGWLTPEIALGLGNLVAFGLGNRGRTRLRLVRSVRSGDVLDLRFAPSRPLRIAAGQYVEVDVPQSLDVDGGRSDLRGRRRVLSPASAPGAAEVRLVTRVPHAAHASPVKRALAQLTQGQVISVTAVGGDFTLPRSTKQGRPLALIGIGIGVTPLLAHLQAIAAGAVPPPPGGWDLVLVHAIARAEDALDPELPRGPEGAACPAGVRLVLVSPPLEEAERAAIPTAWEQLEGDVSSAAGLRAVVPDLSSRELMVSGAPGAVVRLRRAARELDVRKVRTDAFLGY